MRNLWIGKRQGNRSPTSLKATIFIEEGSPLSEIIIVDLSPTGARATIKSDEPLPDMFQINIPSRDETRYVKLRWQKDRQIGLEFIRNTEVMLYQSLNTLTRRLNLLELNLAKRMNLSEGEVFYTDTEVDDVLIGQKQLVPLTIINTGDNAKGVESVTERVARLEEEMAKALELLHAEVAERMTANLAERFSAFEAKSAEIVDTLRKLVPLITRRAA
ncbi:MAG: PilZ domain-containing protein [Hyphomicrobiales bacterium]|nr:PilZ domain-containing protein [Hyphomicrobiales bacterium]